MKAKTKLRRLLSLLLTLVMLASLLPVMGTTASAETGGTINEYLYINRAYKLDNGTYITKDAPNDPKNFDGSEESLPAADTYAALYNDTLYLKGNWGGSVGIYGPKYVKRWLTNPLNIVAMGDTTITYLELLWLNTAKENSGATIDLRDNATLNITYEGVGRATSAIKALYSEGETTHWIGADVTVKGTGTLKTDATEKFWNEDPFVRAGAFSIKDNVNLDTKLAYTGTTDDPFRVYSLDKFVMDTTGYVRIDTSGYANALALPELYPNAYQLKNASSITLTSSKKETMFMGGNGDLVQLFIDRHCAGWNVDRPAADDAAPYTLKLTRDTMPTAAGLTVGTQTVESTSTIPNVTVTGGQTVGVKASVTLPAWLSDMYKDGRVKLGDSGTLSIYKGSSLSTSDKLTGITVPDDLSGSVVSYSTSFTPEAGKTYTVYACIPIVTVKDVKQLGSASVIATIKAEEKPVLPVLDGSIVYTSGVRYGADVTTARTGVVNSIDSNKLHYQWQVKSGDAWTDISGATAGKLDADKVGTVVGKDIRLKITADGYEGVIYSPVKTVAKAAQTAIPVAPELECTPAGGGAFVKLTNKKGDQEYLISFDRPMTDAELANALSGEWRTDINSSIRQGYTLYIYTRMKETATHAAGTIYRYTTVSTADMVDLKNLALAGYTNNTIYVKKGEPLTINVVGTPANANKWNAVHFIEQDNTASHFTVKVDNGSTNFIPAGTGTGTFGNHTITITSDEVGRHTLVAFPADTYNPYATPFGSWTVVVYEPGNITNFDIIDPPTYADVTLAVGESYTPELTNPTLTTKPAEAMTGYTLKWFVMTPAAGAGSTPTYSADNGYISVDENGKVKALAANGTVNDGYKVVALHVVDGSGKFVKSVASYKVTVNSVTAPALESISVLPGTKTLKVGESAALSAIKTPVNASGEFTWTSSNSGVAKVDNTGKVTAVAKGTATITVACGGKTAACTITVIGADHTHSYGAWTKLNDEFHSRSCTGCDEALELKAHDFGAWALDKTDTSRHYRQCSQCGHKVYAAHTASDWIVDTAATATTEGVRHKECTVCGCVVETEKIPAIGKLPFEDVSTDAWFYGDVDYAYRNGLMNGTSTTVFSPDTPTTRGMIVTILYRLEKEPAVSANMPFSDVNSGSYYEKAIIWAEENDIVNGYGNGKFGPDDKITREQMAAILWRYAKYIGYDVSSGDKTDLQSYSDASSVSGYAVEAMKWANGEGIIKGITTTTLSPQGNATRAQVAAILHRFCNLIAG